MDKLIDYEGLGTFQTNLLNDNNISPISTWSSEKISDELNNKANTVDVSTALASKAEKSYVDTALASKAEKSYVDTALASKQDVLNAGNNITISNNAISALGYRYDDYKNSFSIGISGLTSTNTASGTHAFAEGYGTTASGRASHTEGHQTTTSDDAAHAEGSSTTASGYASHAEGYQNVTYNRGEHAEGYLNISHTYDATATDTSSFDKITIHSTGVGYEWTDGHDWFHTHQNAVEVMRNGDYYLYGVGNYDGVHIKNEQGAPANLQTLQEVIAALETRIAALENPNA